MGSLNFCCVTKFFQTFRNLCKVHGELANEDEISFFLDPCPLTCIVNIESEGWEGGLMGLGSVLIEDPGIYLIVCRLHLS